MYVNRRRTHNTIYVCIIFFFTSKSQKYYSIRNRNAALRSIKLVCSYSKSHLTIKFSFKLLCNLFPLYCILKIYKKIIISPYSIIIFYVSYIPETIQLSKMPNLHANIIHMPGIFNAQIYIDQIIMCDKFFKLIYFKWLLDKFN